MPPKLFKKNMPPKLRVNQFFFLLCLNQNQHINSRQVQVSTNTPSEVQNYQIIHGSEHSTLHWRLVMVDFNN
uniref:Putative ovule protein n=1 Tax=Solanum chacoense TaxID=4108 RepID=A0A0V0H6N5_SOLCH